MSANSQKRTLGSDQAICVASHCLAKLSTELPHGTQASNFRCGRISQLIARVLRTKSTKLRRLLTHCLVYPLLIMVLSACTIPATAV